MIHFTFNIYHETEPQNVSIGQQKDISDQATKNIVQTAVFRSVCRLNAATT